MDTTCIGCFEEITNPICSSCLCKQMKVMVNEYDSKLVNEIAPCMIEGDINCISCGRRMGLCAHCFSMDIFQLIKQKNEQLAKEFIGRFDYDLRRSLFNSQGSKTHSHPLL
jgi:hypothetical protein